MSEENLIPVQLPNESAKAYECFCDFSAGGFRTAKELYDFYLSQGQMKATQRTLQQWYTEYQWEGRRAGIVQDLTSDKLEVRKAIELEVLENEKIQVGELRALFIRFVEKINRQLDEDKIKITPSDIIKLAETFSTLARRTANLPTTVTQSHATLTLYKGWEGDFRSQSENEQLKILQTLAESSLMIAENNQVIDAKFIDEEEEII